MLDKVITAVAFARVIIGFLFITRVTIVCRLITKISGGLDERVVVGLTVNDIILPCHDPLTIFPSPIGAVRCRIGEDIFLLIAVIGIEIFVVASRGVLRIEHLKMGRCYRLFLSLFFAYPLAVDLIISLAALYVILVIIAFFARFHYVAIVVDIAVDAGFCAIGSCCGQRLGRGAYKLVILKVRTPFIIKLLACGVGNTFLAPYYLAAAVILVIDVGNNIGGIDGHFGVFVYLVGLGVIRLFNVSVVEIGVNHMLSVKAILIFVPLGHLALVVKLHLQVVVAIAYQQVGGYGYPFAVLQLFVYMFFGHGAFV